MAGGRPRDPKRTRRGTGNRPKPGEAKLTLVPAIVDDPSTSTSVTIGYQPPPDDLPECAHEIWNAAMVELAGKHLKAADLEALRMMCNAAARSRQAAADIARYGLVVEGKKGPIVNPLTKLEKDATAVYLRIATEYGLTLAARIRLGLMQLAGESMLHALNSDLDQAAAAAAGGAPPAKKSTAKKPAKKRPTKKRR